MHNDLDDVTSIGEGSLYTAFGGGPGDTPSLLYQFNEFGAVVPLGRGLVDQYTKGYHQVTSKVYNALLTVIKEAKLSFLPFMTAMTYFHVFLRRRADWPVDPMVLGAACIFLAFKSESMPKHANLERIIPFIFPSSSAASGRMSSSTTGNSTELLGGGSSAAMLMGSPPRMSEEEFQARKQQVLTMEMMLCHTLNFDFHVDHPQNHVEKLLAQAQSADVNSEMYRMTHKVLLHAIHTPLCVEASPTEIAEAAFSFVGEALLPQMRQSIRTMVTTPPERLTAIQNTIRLFLVYSGKSLKIPQIDEQIALSRTRRRELRTPTPQSRLGE